MIAHAKLATMMQVRYGLLPVQITSQSLILRVRGLFCLSKHHQWMSTSITENSPSTVSTDACGQLCLEKTLNRFYRTLFTEHTRSHYSRRTVRLRTARELSACLDDPLLHIFVTPNTKTHTFTGRCVKSVSAVWKMRLTCWTVLDKSSIIPGITAKLGYFTVCVRAGDNVNVSH